MMYLIPALSFFRHSGFVSGSIVPFQRAYARPKASCFGREPSFFRRHFLLGSRCAGQHGIIEKYIENQNIQANSRKKSWMKNLISAAHITSSSCLDKCNRFVSNFIPSRSTKCIFIMTWTPNLAVRERERAHIIHTYSRMSILLLLEVEGDAGLCEKVLLILID